MKTQQLNFRIEADLLAALQREADAEYLDSATMIRKLLREGMAKRRLERALLEYQKGEISIGRACEDSGLSHWDMLRLLQERRISTYRETPEEAAASLERILGKAGRVAEKPRSNRPPVGARRDQVQILPDSPTRRGGVLLVGMHPAPASAEAGHHWQGRLGKRLWRSLARLGLLSDPIPGREDESFVAAGNGITNIIKRTARSPAGIKADEIRLGVEVLRMRVERWAPSLLIFVSRDAARAALSTRAVAPGPCAIFGGVPTFLLTEPNAASNEVHENEAALLKLLGTRGKAHGILSQGISAADITEGSIRFPREAKALLPRIRGNVDVVIRGQRLRVSYDPRVGPDRARNARLHIGREMLERMVRAGERLHLHVGSDGLLHLD